MPDTCLQQVINIITVSSYHYYWYILVLRISLDYDVNRYIAGPVSRAL